MSYILEALKKAQAERQLGSAPTIHAPAPTYAPPGAAAGSRRRHLAIGIGAGVLVAAGALLWARQAGQEPPSEQQPAPARMAQAEAAPVPAPAPVAPMPATPAQAEPAVATPGGAPAPVTAGPAPATPAAPAAPVLERAAPPMPAPVPAPAVAASGEGRPPAPAVPPATPQRTTQAPVSQPVSQPVVQPVVQPVAPEPARAAAPAGAAGSPAAVPAADEGLPTLVQLPEALQREIPRVAFGGYIYSPNPAERLLLVDKTLRREGEEVAPGLVLERLLPRAAVMNYRGTRYRVGY